MEFWTAPTAIATGIAALVAAGASVVALQVLQQTRRQVGVEVQQVEEMRKQAYMSQQQLEVMQKQIKAQYLPIVEFRRKGDEITDQYLFNAGYGPACNIMFHLPGRNFKRTFSGVLSPGETSKYSLTTFIGDVGKPEAFEEMTITYSDVVGESYSNEYTYLAQIDPPRWVSGKGIFASR